MKLRRKWVIAAAAIVVAGAVVCAISMVIMYVVRMGMMDIEAAKKEHREFVGAEPKAADVVGTYILSDQTVIPGGLSALGGRQCVLNVFADGRFSITNYPDCDGALFSKLKQYNTFHSTVGTWELAVIGASYGYGPVRKQCWGLRFTHKIGGAAFTGPDPPYGLLTIIDDPDCNYTLRFKKKEHPTTKSTLSSEGVPAKVAARAIREALADENEYVRTVAAEALPRLSAPDEGLRVLIAFLADESAHVRQWATRTLAGLGAAAKPAIPALTEALKDTDADVRFAAAEALVKLGVPGRAVSGLIASLLEDKRWYNRKWAARLLGDVGPPAKKAVPSLVEALVDKDWRVRLASAQALGRIGPAAKAALPALRRALRDEEEYVRKAAAEALKKIQQAHPTTAPTQPAKGS